MAIKHQPKSDKHPYASPTTPGLYVTFRDYVIELVCLNVNPKIGPRFWSDKSYWGPKYGREIRGVSNLGKELDLTDVLTQTALIYTIKEYRIKALVAKKTVARVVRITRHRIEILQTQRKTLSQKPQREEIDSKKNSTFVDTGQKNVLARIRDVENG
ncbi:MAG: hypothetical protein ACYSWS_01855 [Planctomycetota bacterium]|jgi:hypothetical protein